MKYVRENARWEGIGSWQDRNIIELLLYVSNKVAQNVINAHRKTEHRSFPRGTLLRIGYGTEFITSSFIRMLCP